MYKDDGNTITREDYRGGYGLYVFDLSPDLSVGGHLNLVRHGNLRLGHSLLKSAREDDQRYYLCRI